MKGFILSLLFIVAAYGDNDINTKIASIATKQIGNSYVWGGENPQGFDCSGYTRFVYQKIGLSLPRTAIEQSNIGAIVPPSSLEKGDLLFFLTDKKRNLPITHVGIYLGNGYFIHAASKKEGVIVSPLSGKYERLFVKATRPTMFDITTKNKIMNNDFFSAAKRALVADTRIPVKYNLYSIQNGKYTSE